MPVSGSSGGRERSGLMPRDRKRDVVNPVKPTIMQNAMNQTIRPLVAINAHLLSGDASYRSAGISTYISRLVEHLNDIPSPFRYEVFVGDEIPAPSDRIAVRRSRWSTHRPMRRVIWEQTVLPPLLRRMGASLLHAPAFVAPMVRVCPQVLSVHDLSFIRHPEFFRAANRLYLRAFTRLSSRRATAVLTISNATAREINRLLGVPSERIFTVYPGVSPDFYPRPDRDVARFRRERGLPDRFVLYLGTLEPRKNLVRLVRAFARLDLSDVHLVLAGAKGWYFEGILAEVARLGLEDRVHLPGYVTSESLPFWYNAASVFAYPSIYEGFGIPVLEALACGIPTLTSSATSLPEAGGDATLQVSPLDEEAIATGLYRLLTDDELREEARVRGLAHASNFSWAKMAKETTEVYRWALARNTLA